MKKEQQIKGYTIDGKTYRSKALRDYHEELKNNLLVKSFDLPTLNNERDRVNKKYHSYMPTINGITFDSIMESQLYLSLLATEGIESLERQVTFILQEGFTDKNTGDRIRPITYIADFVVNSKGQKYVIDAKGKETEVFKIKKKLFMYKYPDLKFLCLRWIPKTGKWTDLRDLKKEKRRDAAIKSQAKKRK